MFLSFLDGGVKRDFWASIKRVICIICVHDGPKEHFGSLEGLIWDDIAWLRMGWDWQIEDS